MSGGFFQYKQYDIGYIADQVDQLIRKNDSVEWYQFSPEVIEEFRTGLDLLRRAEIYAQRIDWMISGDDAVETFLRRLQEDLANYKAITQEKV